jgi:hypothetical protein
MAETSTDDDAQMQQTHIYNPDVEFREHAVLRVGADDVPSSRHDVGHDRVLILSEGGDIGSPDPGSEHIYWIRGEGGHQRTVWRSVNDGIAYYLHALELHIPEEKYAMAGMIDNAEESGLPLREYIEWRESMTDRERRLRLLDLLDFRIEHGDDWAAEPYRDVCEWRETGLSESARALAERIDRQVDTEPHLCYRVAQQAAIHERENHRVQYVEGLALPKTLGQCIRHAWIEIDGRVAELTWPWHKYDPEGAVYFGAEFDADEVAEKYERRNGGSQLILSDEEIARLTQVVDAVAAGDA